MEKNLKWTGNPHIKPPKCICKTFTKLNKYGMSENGNSSSYYILRNSVHLLVIAQLQWLYREKLDSNSRNASHQFRSQKEPLSATGSIMKKLAHIS